MLRPYPSWFPATGEETCSSSAYRSIVAQELEDWEAIVVDDGTPTTEVREGVERLRDDRIRYVRHDRNRGLGAARNTGFRAARADVVLPIDSDDSLDPSFLRVTLTALQEDPMADFVFTDFQLFGDADRVRHQCVRSLRELLQADWIPGPGTVQRKRVWERVGGYCEFPTMTAEEDWDYWIGACERGHVAKHIAMPLYRYRLHGDSMTAKVWSSEFQLRELIYARHKRTFDDHGLGSAFRAAGYLGKLYRVPSGWTAGSKRAPGHPCGCAGTEEHSTVAQPRGHVTPDNLCSQASGAALARCSRCAWGYGSRIRSGLWGRR